MTESCFLQCMKMLSENNMDGLKQVYDEYGRMIYSAVIQICKSPHTAEDITSDFFLRLRNAASVYKESRGHKKWLMISARNLAIDHMRRQKHELPVEITEENGEIDPVLSVSDGTDTEGEVTGSFYAQSLLSQLDSPSREIINLKVYCGFTFAEIADILHIPQGTAAWKYRTAISRLKKIIGEDKSNG